MYMRQLSRLSFAFVAPAVGQSFAMADLTSGPWVLGDIVVEQAWARVNPGGAKTGAVYLTIHNKSGNDDLLLAVDSPAAKGTSVHESRVVDNVARMEPVPAGLDMPSQGEVVMRPGGLHIMLTGLSRASKPGTMLPVTMVFRDAGSLEFEVPILLLGAGDPTVKHTAHGG